MSSEQQHQHVDDEYDEYNYDADKYAAGSGHSGKCRTKKEAEQHTNRTDPGGHTRKTTQKLINSHDKEKEERKAHLDSTDKSHQKKSCAYYVFLTIISPRLSQSFYSVPAMLVKQLLCMSMCVSACQKRTLKGLIRN